MDMNISMRDKKLLLMFLGVGIFACGYFFGYRPQMEEAENIQASNVPLQERLNDLLELAENREFYLEETDSINAKINEYTAEFPSDIRSEDGIVLSKNMEESLDMSISNVGLGIREFIAALDGSTEDPLIDMPDETLSEQANAQTQAQIDEIEGTDTQGEKDLQNASDEEVENAAMTLTTPGLYRTQDSMQFTGTYASLKDMVDYLADQSGRMTLDNVNASFDSTTGNLTGSITVNLFSMAGTGKTYTEPDAGSVAYGTNIFLELLSQARRVRKIKRIRSPQIQRKHRVQTAQIRRLPTLALTVRIQTVREEKIRRMQQPLLIPPDRHNKGKYVRGEKYRAPLSVFLYHI